jgi:(1->4)-alpha-D-glucan 1-alpha-D-glucosylmutase
MIIPSSTYRIQFNRNFTFNHLYNILDYLEDLGITTIYASPVLQAAKGSEHGYDGIDVTRINEELGTPEEMRRLAQGLKKKGIGWIQDIVPNHLAFDTNNTWLKDVLERGMNSSYATYFDIDWEHPFYTHKLMVPFLEAPVSDCLRQNILNVRFREDGFFLAYRDLYYPISPETYPLLISGCFNDEFNNVNSLLNALISNNGLSYEQSCGIKSELMAQLNDETVAFNINEKIKEINTDNELLLSIVNSQHYALCYHMDSNTSINYRRFFNVNGLICLRMEDEVVFNAYHAFIHKLYEMGHIQGLRIDHVDGLRNPVEYVDRLRALFGEDCYIIVEKILDDKEELPEMRIQGTSGYEFLSYINQVITDNKGSEKLLKIYNSYVPEFKDYDKMVFEKKLSFLEPYLNGEWDNLLRLLLSLSLIEDEEIKMPALKKALGVFMAAFPVYRAYVEKMPLDRNDAELVKAGFDKALRLFPDLSYELTVLQSLFEPHEDITKTNNRLTFIQRLFQFTGPLAAKGVEDTAFYLYNPLISHNEVGDQPRILGINIKEFHNKMLERQEKNPYSFNCTSTHDTKRGEDARVRINIISEMADEWKELVAYWQKINEPYRQVVAGEKAPIVNDIYYLYQAIIGGFPEDLKVNRDFVERTKIFFIKVLRESKLRSEYINPNYSYEAASGAFIEHLLNSKDSFLPSLMPFVKKIIQFANTYTMVQVIIKCTAPGIPDIYRGCELWDLSYVDPDNRRYINYDLRKRLVHDMKVKDKVSRDALLEYAEKNYEIGTQKMFVTREVLRFRKQHPDLFIKAAYIPIYGGGSERKVLAFMRRHEDEWVLVILPMGIVDDTGKALNLELPAEAPTKWKNLFTHEDVSGKTIDVHELFRKFPVAVLIQQPTL